MLRTFGAERSSAGVKGIDRHGNGWLNLQRSSYLYPISFIPGRVNASPSDTQGGSPVRESRPPGSVRGVPSNGHSYRDRNGNGSERSKFAAFQTPILAPDVITHEIDVFPAERR
jgi:hypothetical protein